MNTKNPQIGPAFLLGLLIPIIWTAPLPLKAQMASQHFQLPASVQNSGGGLQGSAAFSLQSSFGQASPPGISQSANFGLSAGFQSYVKSCLLQGQRGDIDNNGVINVLDVLAVVNDILGTVPLDEQGRYRADCNGDGSINVLDALGIVNVILGITPECPGNSDRIAVHPDAAEFLKSLEPYFPPEQFEKFMKLVKQVQIPDKFGLNQNYPNPFNPTTTISYSLPVQSRKYKVEREGDGTLNVEPYTFYITLKIFNVMGQEVATLVDEVKEPGYYTVTWDASDMPSGVYFCRLTAGGFSETKRMVLVR